MYREKAMCLILEGEEQPQRKPACQSSLGAPHQWVPVPGGPAIMRATVPSPAWLPWLYLKGRMPGEVSQVSESQPVAGVWWQRGTSSPFLVLRFGFTI